MMMKSLLLIFTLFLCLRVLSQENHDSLQLDLNIDRFEMASFSFDPVYSQRYPMSGLFNAKNQMINQFFNISPSDLQTYGYFAFPDNSYHYFSRNGFSSFIVTNPLTMGFNLHLKEKMGWDKLDVFFDGVGTLFHLYDLPNGNQTPSFDRQMIWQVGAGLGYEIKPGNTLFIKGSVNMQGSKPTGFGNIGGMHMKF